MTTNYRLDEREEGFVVTTPKGNVQCFRSRSQAEAYLRWHQGLYVRAEHLRALERELDEARREAWAHAVLGSGHA